MSHTADPFTGEPSEAEMLQAVAWVQNHQSPEAVPESPAEQTAPFVPVWDGPETPAAVITAVPRRRSHRMPLIPPRQLHRAWDDLGGIGIQACSGCGAAFTDESVRDTDEILHATRASAALSGSCGSQTVLIPPPQ